MNTNTLALQYPPYFFDSALTSKEKLGLCQYTYNFSLFHVIEEDKITEHCYEAEKPETCHNVDDCVLQVKFPCNNQIFIDKPESKSKVYIPNP